jgi:hypothetical protein
MMGNLQTSGTTLCHDVAPSASTADGMPNMMSARTGCHEHKQDNGLPTGAQGSASRQRDLSRHFSWRHPYSSGMGTLMIQWVRELFNPQAKCHRIGHIPGMEYREGFRRPEGNHWSSACVQVSDERPVCLRCLTVVGDWQETRRKGAAAFNWPVNQAEVFNSAGEYWVTSGFYIYASGHREAALEEAAQITDAYLEKLVS